MAQDDHADGPLVELFGTNGGRLFTIVGKMGTHPRPVVVVELLLLE